MVPRHTSPVATRRQQVGASGTRRSSAQPRLHFDDVMNASQATLLPRRAS